MVNPILTAGTTLIHALSMRHHFEGRKPETMTACNEPYVKRDETELFLPRCPWSTHQEVGRPVGSELVPLVPMRAVVVGAGR